MLLLLNSSFKLFEFNKKWFRLMKESPSFEKFSKYGTGDFLNWMNEERGTFPTNNWQKSVFEKRKQLQ